MNENNNHNGSNGNLSRRHTYAHLHLKPTMVFDHIKTKVKRKRNSSCTSPEAPAFVNSQYLLGDGFSQDTNQIDVDRARSQTRKSSIEDQDNRRSEINRR